MGENDLPAPSIFFEEQTLVTIWLNCFKKNLYIFALKRNSNMTGKDVSESEDPLEEPGAKEQ